MVKNPSTRPSQNYYLGPLSESVHEMDGLSPKSRSVVHMDGLQTVVYVRRGLPSNKGLK